MNTLLIVGFGDIAHRAVPLLRPHFDIAAMVRPARLADECIHPVSKSCPATSTCRTRWARSPGAPVTSSTAHRRPSAEPPIRARKTCLRRFKHIPTAARIVYISTSGIYGNCDGAFVDETRPLDPQSDRARRRVDAERRLLRFGESHGVRTVILRAPGIYAADRLPLQRLRNRTPCCVPKTTSTQPCPCRRPGGDGRCRPDPSGCEGVYNACDDSALTMDRGSICWPIERHAAPASYRTV